MRKSKSFCPDSVSALEERVVAAGGLHAAAVHATAVHTAAFNAIPVVSTKDLNFVVQASHNSLLSFLNDYKRVINTIRVDASGTPNDADLNRFYNFLSVRTTKLSNQLTAISGKVPYGRQNLAPYFQDRAFTLYDTLASVTTVQEARRPGPAAQEAFRGIKSDLQDYVVSSVQSGLFRVR